MKKIITVKNEELNYCNVNLTSLALKYGTPLKVTFLDLIQERIVSLKETFIKAIKNNDYKGNIIYLNANKANYGIEEILTACKYADGLECSSYNDLLLTKNIFKNPLFKNKHIYCNGFKDSNYINEIINFETEYDIVDIIDNLNEYNYLKENVNNKLKIGIRINLPYLYTHDNDYIKNDRFGVTESDFETILSDLKNHPNLSLTTIHFHQRGFDYEEDKFLINLEKVFTNYFVKANKLYSSCTFFNMGGGTPLKVDSDFDYDSWANLTVTNIKKWSIINNITEPNIILENGKYTQKDSTVNIYKVVGVKNTDKYPWYIIDGSLLIAMPEMYALGEEILVSPINHLGSEKEKVRLAGLTCDCDDIYYLKDKGYISIPKKTPSNDIFIAALGTGSYQNSMNGKGGIHHCLIPEEKDILIYSENINGNIKITEKVRKELQTIKDIIKTDDIIKINNFK